MTAEAWVGIAAIVCTLLAGAIGWAAYIAWMASQMNANITGLRIDFNAHKAVNDAEQQKIWKAVNELCHVSQAHESRLVRLEIKHGGG
jgi:hypothetical protein